MQKTEAETPAHKSQAKRDTSVFYTYEEKRTKGQRQKANNAAIKLLKEFNSGKRTIESLTDDDREILAKYTGRGGNLTTADGKKGSSYEYYTPKPIAQAAWSLMQEMGFNGGKVLDPCAGVGIFGATSPTNAVIDAVELDGTSGSINQLINQGIASHITISPFEKIAINTADNTYDAVMANVPSGTNTDRGGNQFHDNKYQQDSLESYFMSRTFPAPL